MWTLQLCWHILPTKSTNISADILFSLILLHFYKFPHYTYYSTHCMYLFKNAVCCLDWEIFNLKKAPKFFFNAVKCLISWFIYSSSFFFFSFTLLYPRYAAKSIYRLGMLPSTSLCLLMYLHDFFKISTDYFSVLPHTTGSHHLSFF